MFAPSILSTAYELGAFFLVFVCIVLGITLTIIPFWKICDRAGLPPALSLLMLVPIVNIILPFYIAFTNWPATREPRPVPN
jgi:heme/copper-type cytochrome/quinol oxidase subunit 4